MDTGQFVRSHKLVVDSQDRSYVADRECHRVQVFDGDGNFAPMWSNIHHPVGMDIGPDGNFYVADFSSFEEMGDACGLGHLVNI